MAKKATIGSICQINKGLIENNTLVERWVFSFGQLYCRIFPYRIIKRGGEMSIKGIAEDLYIGKKEINIITLTLLFEN